MCCLCKTVPQCVALRQDTSQPPPRSKTHPLAVNDKGSKQKQEVLWLTEVNLQLHRGSWPWNEQWCLGIGGGGQCLRVQPQCQRPGGCLMTATPCYPSLCHCQGNCPHIAKHARLNHPSNPFSGLWVHNVKHIDSRHRYFLCTGKCRDICEDSLSKF